MWSKFFNYLVYVWIHVTDGMECYATPWPLWRDSRNLWHFIELTFAFGIPLSLFLPYCSLFSVFIRVIARLQARGTRAAIKGGRGIGVKHELLIYYTLEVSVSKSIFEINLKLL